MSTFSTQELLELAQLDVLGLLDAEERESFERAFRAAPPALQAQIRREQTRLAGDGMTNLLPQVEPPLGLRARVLSAIRDAMTTVAGRSRDRDIAGRLTPEIAAAHGVNRWWRAGAIGAVAAAVVFAFTTLQVRSDYDQLAAATRANQMTEFFLKEYGHRFEKSLLSPSTRFVQFSPADTSSIDSDGVGKALLLLDQSTNRAQLLLKNLASASGEYSLVIMDEQGQIARAVLEFRTTGNGIESRNIEGLDLEGAGSLAIIESRPGRASQTALSTVLKSSRL